MAGPAVQPGERLLVAFARRLERPAQAILGRPRVRSALHRRARRAWRATDAPLILCFGNINRSAFVAALARKRGRAGAHSGGFYPEPGRPSPRATIAGAGRYGVDLAGHRSSCVTRAELAGAAAIFVFDLENVARVAALDPASLARVHLIGSLDDDVRVLIADPHGHGAAVLDQTLERIARALASAEPAPGTDPLEGRDVVCVGFNDWDNEIWTNQHHLMSRLAASGSRVLFIESLGLRRPDLGSGRDLRRIGRRLRRGLSRPRQRDGVTVLSPLVVPLHSSAWVRALNRHLLRFSVRLATRRMGLRAPVLWGYVPQAEILLDAVDPELVVYHCVDDIAAQEGIDVDSFNAAERRFAARADLVIASSPALAERMRTLSSHVLYAPNVADTDLFATALDPGPVDPRLSVLPEPRIVFVGAIAAKKLDLELLAGLADARRDWTFALVGPVGLGDPDTDVSALAARPNVHLLGARAQTALPDVLRGAAVGLIPYRTSRLTESIFPMKVYEYLAAGLPVVATGLPALAGVDGVELAEGAEDALAAVQRALGDDSPERRRARSEAVRDRSWSARLAEIGSALQR
ncbi:MAG TPA: glycosyltransferase [Solirubrobacteraceae bacterium]|jgi:glycosyltransferase involved in cell wall biosynthesis